jgi:hypothetical protein
MAPTSATDCTLPDDDARLCAMLAMRPMLQRLPGIRLAGTPVQQPYDRLRGLQRLPVCWDVTRFPDPEGPIQASLADRRQADHGCGKSRGDAFQPGGGGRRRSGAGRRAVPDLVNRDFAAEVRCR